MQVSQIIKHPEYSGSSLQRDIALLALRERVTYSQWVQPVCLWPEEDTSLQSIVGRRGSVCRFTTISEKGRSAT
jgi:hypothetical protein